MRLVVSVGFLVSLATGAPSAALAMEGLSGGTILAYSSIPAKMMMVVLTLAALAATAITIRKVISGPNVAGGSAFISALRMGAPLVGLLGAAVTVFDIFIALANVGPGVPLAVTAPGLAEGMLVFIVGLIVGIVAVICHAVVEARIDRAVLRS